MKRTYIRARGNKANAWLRARVVLIKDAVAEGRLEIIDGKTYGKCEDCKRFKYLTPDHIRKRSLGGSHHKSNIAWVCLNCHRKRDNEGDPMGKKKKTKKPNWAVEHKCKSCKRIVSSYLCGYCQKASV